MANLKALRQKVKNITDYSPELAQFDDQLDELLNDAYYCLWTMKRWNFTTKLGTMRLHTDILPSTDTENNSGNDVELDVTKGERQVRFTADIDRLHDVDIWEGQPIEIDTMEYTINRCDGARTLLLDRPFDGDTSATNTQWKVKKRFYDLPEDCLELLYLGHRDYPYVSVTGSQNPYGKSTAILPRREEDLDLRVDYTQSYAEGYITSPSQNVAPGEVTDTAVLNNGGGDFPTNNFYEFAWAFVKDGKVGALSEPKVHEVTIANSQITIKFDSWDGGDIVADTYNARDRQPAQWEGYRKVVVWNKNFDKVTGERKGFAVLAVCGQRWGNPKRL